MNRHLLALAVFSVPAAAAATPLPPGSTVIISDFAGTLGTQIAQSSESPGLGVATFEGTFRSAVYQNDDGTLDFVYQFTNDTGPSSVQRLTFSAFDNFAVDIFRTGADIDGADDLFTVGNQMALNADRSISGEAIGVNFSDGSLAGRINPGESSFTYILRTSATSFTDGVFGAINGGALSVVSFAPEEADVPEPGALGLLGLGALALAYSRRAKRPMAR
ncbi:PEP-CTERM sorting domain-containing protein [Pacificimonas flava]|uniref:Ice-binding protein C-terminal domain-containing protein n=1 Tax=Pacificimonas flava TaxID=1234595 RepID=M2T9P3_9SPHN|nr:PEP-CTERM sorting domain-containing protein [Pacificimonas flava]EMD83299.1 hypothetical protein C725_1200 [Pacificimonas flava]MBB5279141.1 hypothetical protein [Pacificimonas flava]